MGWACLYAVSRTIAAAVRRPPARTLPLAAFCAHCASKIGNSAGISRSLELCWFICKMQTVAFASFALLAFQAAAVEPYLSLGAEWTTVPPSTIDLIPWCSPFQNSSGPGLAPIDSAGWPLSDSYLICFDYRPSPVLSPAAAFSLNMTGSYYFNFSGKANMTVYTGGEINATVEDVSFDAESWTTAGFVVLHPGSAPALAFGFEKTQRNATASPNSGVANIVLVQPEYGKEWFMSAEGQNWLQTRSGIVTDVSGATFTSAATSALQLFNYTRVMEWSRGNYNPGTYVRNQFLEWNESVRLTDAIWSLDGYVRPSAHGAPWETAVILARTCNKNIWINIPVSASGRFPNETASFVSQLASLFRYGNTATGNLGIQPGATIFIEHSNEVWLNASYQHAWNLAAAVDEVSQGGSNLNNDGNASPLVWANRRHIRRVMEVGAIFKSVFQGTPVSIRPVFGQYQNNPDDLIDALTWFNETFGSPADYMYGVAINCYYIAYAPPNTTQQQMFDGMVYASGAEQLPLRLNIASIIAPYGLKMVSYEGAPVVIPQYPDDNATISVILEANRNRTIEFVLANDYLTNWQNASDVAAEYNYYALSSQYGPPPVFSWGLTEDIRNLSTWKMAAVAYEATNPNDMQQHAGEE